MSGKDNIPGDFQGNAGYHDYDRGYVEEPPEDASEYEDFMPMFLSETSSREFEDEDPSGFADNLLGGILGGDLGRHAFASEIAQEIVPRPLAREEASESLCKLGKTADGLQHAYLMMKAIDKQVNEISVITAFKHVMFIDVSGNVLTEKGLAVLHEMDFLLMLKADDNQVKSCVLPKFPYLQHLSLNKNFIMSTEGLIHPNLEILELNDNSIKKVTGIDTNLLEHLKHLAVKGNGLETTLGLQIPTLERLYIGENYIENLQGFESLKKLKILHLRENTIFSLEGVEHLESLEYLNIRSCNVKSILEMKRLVPCTKLETLIVLDNPFVKQLGMSYRVKILSILRKLKRIDKSPVQSEELVHADEVLGEEEEVLTETEFGTDTETDF